MDCLYPKTIDFQFYIFHVVFFTLLLIFNIYYVSFILYSYYPCDKSNGRYPGVKLGRSTCFTSTRII